MYRFEVLQQLSRQLYFLVAKTEFWGLKQWDFVLALFLDCSAKQIISRKQDCFEVLIVIIFLEHKQTINMVYYKVQRIQNDSHNFWSLWFMPDERSQEDSDGHWEDSYQVYC